MATKKKKKSTVSEAVKLQKLANTSAIKIQNMVNQANKEQMSFNRSEAQTARDFNQREAATAREFNALEAEKARSWQTEMSNTSHQREVEDLKKAGINPVLSANSGGAQSYTTSSANAQNASGSGASTNVESGASMFGSLMNSLMSSMSALKQTQMQNDSALRVAKVNAAANKYATDVSANTARYVANTNYEASRYSSDMNYKTQMDKPQNGVGALIDKYFGKTLGNFAGYINSALVPGKDYGYWNNGDRFTTTKANGLFQKFLDQKTGVKDTAGLISVVLGRNPVSNFVFDLCVDALIKGNPLSVKKLNHYCSLVEDKYGHKRTGVQK